MKTLARSSFTFPSLVLAFAALATPFVARAGEGCKPVHGFYTSSIQTPCAGALCTAGELIGGIQGTYAFVATGLLPPPALTTDGAPALAGALFYVGESVVVLKQSGDHVFASDAGVIDVGGTGKQAALLVVTGGTGARSGATGFLQLRGSLEAGEVAGDYFGEICTP